VLVALDGGCADDALLLQPATSTPVATTSAQIPLKPEHHRTHPVGRVYNTGKHPAKPSR